MAIATTTPVRSPIRIALDAVVERVITLGGNFQAGEEARRIVEWFRVNDPDTLFDYFDDRMAAVLCEDLTTRLANARHKLQAKSVFKDPGPVSVLAAPYPGYENRWQQLADFRRPDWQALAQRSAWDARPSLIELELAKIMLKRLTDDTTRTREVLGEDEYIRLRATCADAADTLLATDLVQDPKPRRRRN